MMSNLWWGMTWACVLKSSLHYNDDQHYPWMVAALAGMVLEAGYERKQ